jgi:hypothetical protein
MILKKYADLKPRHDAGQLSKYEPNYKRKKQSMRDFRLLQRRK